VVAGLKTGGFLTKQIVRLGTIFTALEASRPTGVGLFVSTNGGPIPLSRIAASCVAPDASVVVIVAGYNETRVDRETLKAGKVRGGTGTTERASERAIRSGPRRGRWAPALTSHLTLAGRLFYLIRDLRMRTRRPQGIPLRERSGSRAALRARKRRSRGEEDAPEISLSVRGPGRVGREGEGRGGPGRDA